MSKFKGANGKWEFIDTHMDPRMYQYAIVNESGVKLVAMVVKSSREEEYALANARLIAAAPDLLEALQDCLTTLQWLYDCIETISDHETYFNSTRNSMELAKNAIKKATGDE